MKILCLGHLTYDLTFPVSTFPKENTKNHIKEKNEGAGGPSTIAALLLSKWDMDVVMAGRIGDDHYGHAIKKELSLNRINTDYIEMDKKFKTANSVNIANAENESRTLFIYEPSNGPMSEIDLDFQPDVILVDGYEATESKRLINKYPKAISILDAGKENKDILELAKMVNYLVCSKSFAESVSGMKIDFDNKKTLVDVFKKLEAMLKTNVIVTLEEKGCLYRIENKIKLMPSIRVKTIDTNGAGDIFHGAFTYGIANGFDLEKTLKYSNIAGSLSVTRLGSYDSIPTLKEVETIYEEIG